MKIAVCISGVPRSGIGDHEEVNRDFKRNFKNLRKNFASADFYVGTWRQHEDRIKSDFLNHYWLFDEPKAHYHPYLSMPKTDMISDKMRKFSDIYRKLPQLHERTKYQAHQILCHANMVNSLPEKYDVIVRARFDTFTYTYANFEKYVKAAYNKKIATGFATLKPDFPKFNIARELTKADSIQNDGAVSIHNNLQKYLFDQLIIHSGECINTEHIFKLYEQQLLCPAEFGWYQVLSQPYNDNHKCIAGWAETDRRVLPNFLQEAKV